MGVLVSLPFIYNFAVLDHAGRPFCHKQIALSVPIWRDDHHTDQLPNVRGSSHDSLAELRDLLNTDRVEKNYMYVPGLREGDPGDLVFMYLRVPTRWIWHGQARTRFKPKGWIIVPLDFEIFGSRKPSGPGECSEWVPFPEFRSRLLTTLDFLRTNNRPNWQAVVAEHTKFLESIERREP